MSLINSLSYEAVQKGISNNLTVRMYESRDGDKNGNKEDKKPHVIVNDELEISFT